MLGAVDGLACASVTRKWEPFFEEMEMCFEGVDEGGNPITRSAKDRDARMAKVELPLLLTRSYFGTYYIPIGLQIIVQKIRR